MTKTISTLAALFLATSALSSAAEAGGVRLSFGGPRGSFTAHERLSDGPAGTARYARPHCDKPSYASKPSYSVSRHNSDDDARRSVRKKVEVAEAPVHKTPRKPKVYIEKEDTKPEVKTAKLEDKSVISDAAPAITIPQSPTAQPQVNGTQSSPAVTASTPAQTAAQTATETATATPAPVSTTQTAALETAPITGPVIAPDAEPKTTVSATEVASEPAKAEPVKVEPEKPAKTAKGKSDSSMAARLCKRFSAAVAGVIDVPCE
jgi:hypothetical protein